MRWAMALASRSRVALSGVGVAGAAAVRVMIASWIADWIVAHRPASTASASGDNRDNASLGDGADASASSDSAVESRVSGASSGAPLCCAVSCT